MGLRRRKLRERKIQNRFALKKIWCKRSRSKLNGFAWSLRPQFPGIAAAWVYADEPDYESFEASAGLSDLSNPTFLIPQDTFQMGELTETFVVAGLLHLQEENQLSLDGPLRDYLSEGVYEPLGDIGHVSLAQLARHESGLAGSYAETLPSDPTPAEKISFFESENRVLEVGEYYPCPVNTVLLGLVIEQVASLNLWRSLGDFLKNNVALGSMNKTDFPTSANYDVVKGYEVEAEGDGQTEKYLEKPGSYHWGDRHLVSNVGELAEWFHVLNSTGDVLPTAATELMTDWKGDFGMGVRKFSLKSSIPGLAVGQKGGLPGYAAMVTHWPEASLTLALAINQTGAIDVETVLTRVLDVFLEEADCAAFPY